MIYPASADAQKLILIIVTPWYNADRIASRLRPMKQGGRAISRACD
jgi:hypothetical protein